ncbi:MAG: NAD-dependent epimerase/dehydratase family protein [Bacteroidota bacterium]|nr:NAD-dependent epimerase/dehydratase family protein [Bacteroidota bacterium]
MIAVTGATGLLGSHLLFELTNSGHSVIAVQREGSSVDHIPRIFGYYSDRSEELLSRIQWVSVDLMDRLDIEEKLSGVTHLYHCAAMVSFRPTDANRILDINAGMTANLVNWAIATGLEKMVHVSSIAALGREKDNRKLITEETYWKNSPDNSRYAVSKYSAELEIWRGVEEGLNAVIVNPGIILGPGRWDESSSHLIHRMAKGFPFYSKGENGFVDVRDVVDVMMRLMNSGIHSQRYLLVSENMVYKDLFFKIADLAGSKRPWIDPPMWLTGMVWRFEWLRFWLTGSDPLVTKETSRSARGIYRYSNEKVKRELDFTFRSMDETLKDTVDRWKQDHSITS